MSTLPDPVWPVLGLALIQLVDAVLCLRPVAPIAACFDAVAFPRRLWWVFPVVKFAAVAGLLAGLWVSGLGLLTCLALVLYFVLAVAAHVRVRDFSRNLFLNATGMLVICVAVTAVSFATSAGPRPSVYRLRMAARCERERGRVRRARAG